MIMYMLYVFHSKQTHLPPIVWALVLITQGITVVYAGIRRHDILFVRVLWGFKQATLV